MKLEQTLLTAKPGWVLTVIFCAMAAGFTLPVRAASHCDETVNISADYSDISISDGQTVLRGNVVINQCELKISAEEAIIFTSNRQIQRVELTGSPVRVDQNGGNLGKVTATSEQLVYDVASAVMVFTGNARIVHAQGEVKGDQIRYEILNDRFQGGGDENEGRIQIRLEAPQLSPGTETTMPEDR